MIIEFCLWVSCSSSTSSSCVLSGWKPITSRLLLALLALGSEVCSRLLLLLILTIVIEVIEHQIQIGVYILGQMVYNSFLFINRNTKRLVVIWDYQAATVNLLLTLTEVWIQNIILITINLSSWLRKVCRALRLMKELFTCRLHISLILIGNSGNLPTHCRSFPLVDCRSKPMLPHFLLWLGWPRTEVIYALLHYLYLSGVLLHRSTWYALFNLTMVRSHGTCTTTNLAYLLVFIVW